MRKRILVKNESKSKIIFFYFRLGPIEVLAVSAILYSSVSTIYRNLKIKIINLFF